MNKYNSIYFKILDMNFIDFSRLGIKHANEKLSYWDCYLDKNGKHKRKLTLNIFKLYFVHFVYKKRYIQNKKNNKISLIERIVFYKTIKKEREFNNKMKKEFKEMQYFI